MESELFGHLKGSFTGAMHDKQGLFQAAEGGTLLLDEIADLPLATQVKLLRVLQEKAVRPVGSESEVGVDVRLISATHKRLNHEVAAGRFRDDLFYRINVIDIAVPALKDRREDIPDLATHLLAKIAEESSESPKALPPRPWRILLRQISLGTCASSRTFWRGLQRSLIPTRYK